MTKKKQPVERVLKRECDVAMAEKKRLQTLPAAVQNLPRVYRNNQHREKTLLSNAKQLVIKEGRICFTKSQSKY